MFVEWWNARSESASRAAARGHESRAQPPAAHIAFGRNGGLAPINLPLFQGVRRKDSKVRLSMHFHASASVPVLAPSLTQIVPAMDELTGTSYALIIDCGRAIIVAKTASPRETLRARRSFVKRGLRLGNTSARQRFLTERPARKPVTRQAEFAGTALNLVRSTGDQRAEGAALRSRSAHYV
jgi:hypothetical protein